jgi:hypothetical protein
MYNLRYHIASLVSVFLALALGLILGGLIVQRGTFSEQPKAIVESLRKEFADLRDENAKLSDENEQLGSLSAGFVDAWSEDRLAGRSIVVVSNAGRGDGLSAARQAIEESGGRAIVVTLLKPRFGLDDQELAASVSSLAPDPEKAMESLAAALVAEWYSPAETRPLTAALVEAGVMTVTGLEAGASASGLVDLAAPEGEADEAGLQLGVAMVDAGGPAAAAQTPRADSTLATTAVENGLSAFDTLGTEVGRYTLVALMTGADPGFYGTAASADALFPPVKIETTAATR